VQVQDERVEVIGKAARCPGIVPLGLVDAGLTE
jgi:hypothetical protein